MKIELPADVVSKAANLAHHYYTKQSAKAVIEHYQKQIIWDQGLFKLYRELENIKKYCNSDWESELNDYETRRQIAWHEQEFNLENRSGWNDLVWCKKLFTERPRLTEEEFVWEEKPPNVPPIKGFVETQFAWVVSQLSEYSREVLHKCQSTFYTISSFNVSLDVCPGFALSSLRGKDFVCLDSKESFILQNNLEYVDEFYFTLLILESLQEVKRGVVHLDESEYTFIKDFIEK